MSAVGGSKWYHANQYTAESACQKCGGVVRHAYWCPACNPAVAYAYDIVRNAGNLSMEDRLILHALGVVWL